MSEQKPDPAAEPEGAPQIIVPVQSSFLTRLRNYFLTGIIVTAPIGITFYLSWLFINWIDGAVTPLIPQRYNPETYLPFGLPGLGLIVAVLFFTVVGFVTINLFGHALIALGERLVARMPVIRTVYGALKQIFETVLKSSDRSFRQVVLIEYPRKGIWSMAFVSNDTSGEIARRTGQVMVNVFVPTTPNPTSGFLLFVPRADAIFLDMPVEDAAKLIISGGVIVPPDPAAVKARPVPAPGKIAAE